MPLGSENGSLLFESLWRRKAFETGTSIDSPPDARGYGFVKNDHFDTLCSADRFCLIGCTPYTRKIATSVSIFKIICAAHCNGGNRANRACVLVKCVTVGLTMIVGV